MTLHRRIATEKWVNLISQKELPAIASTVKVLDKFSNDDKSSLPKLSQSILHDQALSSCILKVANNCQRIGHPKITTVSRATVVLGIQAVKNICLTSSVLDALFESKKLSPYSYQKLSELMARSFYAGVIAKMLVADYNEDTQEQVYLAAMMYTIGETAFWSIGGNYTTLLAQELKRKKLSPTQACEKVIGCNFNDISRGLAKNWSLGKLVEKALEDPNDRTAEVKIIYLANKLSDFIMNPPSSNDELISLLKEISEIKKITVAQLKRKLNLCKDEASELLSSYGAARLKDNIKPLPTIELDDFEQKPNEKLSKSELLINSVKMLTSLTARSNDVNEFFQLTLELLVDSLNFDQALLFIFTQDKQALKVRFHHSTNEKYMQNGLIPLTDEPNIISYMLENDNHLQIQNVSDKKWLDYLSDELFELLNFGPTSLGLLQINNTPIGLISCQYKKNKTIEDDSFYDDFCFLVEHLNMCLSLISK